MAGVIQLHGEDVSRVEPLFAAYDYDRSLIGGVLEDKNPGHVFCEEGANPTAAILFHPVDYAYLAGDAKAIRIETLVVDAPRAASLEISDFELFRTSPDHVDRCPVGGVRLSPGTGCL